MLVFGCVLAAVSQVSPSSLGQPSLGAASFSTFNSARFQQCCHCVTADVSAVAHPRSAASGGEPWNLLQDHLAVGATVHQFWDMPHLALFTVVGFNVTVMSVGSMCQWMWQHQAIDGAIIIGMQSERWYTCPGSHWSRQVCWLLVAFVPVWQWM